MFLLFWSHATEIERKQYSKVILYLTRYVFMMDVMDDILLLSGARSVGVCRPLLVK